MGLLISTQSFTDPTPLPLIHSGDFEYLGAFALPLGTYGESRLGYGGEAVTPYNDPSTGRHTLFLGGHAWDPGTVAQIEIPSTLVQSADWSALPQAAVLQNFYNIADGRWASLGTTANVSVYGMLPYSGHGYPYYHYVWAYDANDPVPLLRFSWFPVLAGRSRPQLIIRPDIFEAGLINCGPLVGRKKVIGYDFCT
jgi:hypothetical protein